MSRLIALRTFYRGYRFRSRLEARWAVFFDKLGIRYFYEYQGYDLGGVLYLPDFYLPDYRVHVEIKAQTPTDDDLDKAKSLCIADRGMVQIFVGDPFDPELYQFIFYTWDALHPQDKGIPSYLTIDVPAVFDDGYVISVHHTSIGWNYFADGCWLATEATSATTYREWAGDVNRLRDAQRTARQINFV